MSTRESSVVQASITDSPIDPTQAQAAVWHPSAGAVVMFSGIVRDHDGGRNVERLNYSAHPSAQTVLHQVAEDVLATESEVRIWVAHRVGELGIGDHALVAACASAHRAEASAVCAELVERVKAEVPIWKEQFYTDGSKDWVGIG